MAEERQRRRTPSPPGFNKKNIQQPGNTSQKGPYPDNLNVLLTKPHLRDMVTKWGKSHPQDSYLKRLSSEESTDKALSSEQGEAGVSSAHKF